MKAIQVKPTDPQVRRDCFCCEGGALFAEIAGGIPADCPGCEPLVRTDDVRKDVKEKPLTFMQECGLQELYLL
ncbi:hypothetical protein [Paenibacillus turpanensis]|uniref:hypothetical protein n=1 Tax=Paenibacillus turpanensis TaxID=2689078 RepID=UPI00140B0B08|nr:hypothetical protein [Paenibacillus turpanensis]